MVLERLVLGVGLGGLSALEVVLLLVPMVGLLPARWVSRLVVVDALRYE